MAMDSLLVFDEINDDGGIKPTSYMDIKETTAILNELCSADLKISPRVFSKPMFVNTTMIVNSKSNQRPSEILRKNVYYIARNCNNLDEVLAQFVQFGILTLDERSEIKLKVSPLMQAVLTFIKVVKKDEAQFPLFLEILKETDNVKVAELIENNMCDEAAGSSVSNESISVGTDPLSSDCVEPETGPGSWKCSHCTFINPEKVNPICSMCNLSNTGEGILVLQCPSCTLINDPGITTCTICGANMLPDENASEDEKLQFEFSS